MPSKKFSAKYDRAVRRYLRELREGCIDCRVSTVYCRKHREHAFDVVLEPRKVPEFQEFLRQEGLI